MPSSLIIMAVAYAAGSAAAAYGLGTLAVIAIGAAASATASTAINGGSWGEAFGMGLLGGGLAAGAGAALGSAAGSVGEAGASGLGEAAGSSVGDAAGAAVGDSAGAAIGTEAGSGLGASMEGVGAGTADLGGGLSGATSGSTGAFDSGIGGGSGDFGMGASASGASAGGADSSGIGAGMDTGAMDSGIGSSTGSLSQPESTYTGSNTSGGGMEGFQNQGGIDYGAYSQAQNPNANGLGSGTYGSDAANVNQNMQVGSNGSLTGGATDISQLNPGGDSVSNFDAGLQKVKNGLSDFWDAKGPGLNMKTAIQGAGALYDMYGKHQAAQNFQNNLNQMNSMYAPGSAEYNLLQQKLDRQNAAAGRRSQSLTNATNFANQVQSNRNQVLGSSAYLQNQNGYNQNQYSTLNSLFRFGGSLFS